MTITLGQEKGPFKAGENIIKTILNQPENKDIVMVFKIGIFSIPYHRVQINNNSIEIGSTGMLEVKDVVISSLSFEQDEDINSYIDYMAYR